jgi:hypothetical protein
MSFVEREKIESDAHEGEDGREREYHCKILLDLVRTHSRLVMFKLRLESRVRWLVASVCVDCKTGPHPAPSIIFFAGHNEHFFALDVVASFWGHAVTNIVEEQ